VEGYLGPRGGGGPLSPETRQSGRAFGSRWRGGAALSRSAGRASERRGWRRLGWPRRRLRVRGSASLTRYRVTPTASEEVGRSAAAPGIAVGPAAPVRALPAGALHPSYLSLWPTGVGGSSGQSPGAGLVRIGFFCTSLNIYILMFILTNRSGPYPMLVETGATTGSRGPRGPRWLGHNQPLLAGRGPETVAGIS